LSDPSPPSQARTGQKRVGEAREVAGKVDDGPQASKQASKQYVSGEGSKQAGKQAGKQSGQKAPPLLLLLPSAHQARESNGPPDLQHHAMYRLRARRSQVRSPDLPSDLT
jgi:hypothetical protein